MVGEGSAWPPSHWLQAFQALRCSRRCKCAPREGSQWCVLILTFTWSFPPARGAICLAASHRCALQPTRSSSRSPMISI